MSALGVLAGSFWSIAISMDREDRFWLAVKRVDFSIQYV
jgi:hypothetical protein